MTGRFRVLIAGGGIAGLEALLALRHLAGDRVEVTFAAPHSDFLYRPQIVSEPFTHLPADRMALAPLVAELGGRFVHQGVARVRPEERTAELADGEVVSYDAAVMCVGARSRPPYRRATTLWSPGTPLPIDEILRAAAEAPSRRVAFVVPPGVTWALPLYEVAMMSARRARELGLDVGCAVVTPESAPLIMFGPLPSNAVAELLSARNIDVRSGTWATEEEDGALLLRPGHEQLEAGAVLAPPLLEGRAVPGVPADERGFAPIDEHARVKGAEALYAAGDGTNFPIKQGGLGTQQADAAAEHIAAQVGGAADPKPFHPVLRGQLITGIESLNLEADLTGGAGEGVAAEDYLWWPPHKVAGRYLAAWLEGDTPPPDLASPRGTLDVGVSLPHTWHEGPMALDPYERLDTSK